MITLPPFLRQLPHGTETPCAGHGDLFVPDHPKPSASVTDEARNLCAACPVRAACADWAISTRQPHGIWGGLTPDDRQPPRQRRRPACGTETGWRSHRISDSGFVISTTDTGEHDPAAGPSGGSTRPSPPTPTPHPASCAAGRPCCAPRHRPPHVADSRTAAGHLPGTA